MNLQKDNLGQAIMIWEELYKERRKQVDEYNKRIEPLKKELSRLEKEKASIGTTDKLAFLAECIQKEYPVICKITHGYLYGMRIDLYKNSATAKQIRYRRPELVIGGLYVCEHLGDLEYGDERTNVDKHMIYLPMPKSVKEVYDLCVLMHNCK